MKTKKSIGSRLTNSDSESSQIAASSDRWLIRKRFLLAVALVAASVTLFAWGAGGISYGDPARSTRRTVTASAAFHDTFGIPNSALATEDGAYVLVSVTGDTTPCPANLSPSPCGSPTPSPTASPTATATPTGTPPNFTTGVQVFTANDFSNPCGGQQIINFTSSHRLKPVTHIDGIQFFPGSPQVSIGAAIEAEGSEFFRVASLSDPCSMDGRVHIPQHPIMKNCCNCPDCPPGTFDVAVTPDGQYAFVANEYGLMPSPTPATEIGGGTVGIIKVERDADGKFTRGTRPIDLNPTIYIPGGDTIPGITMSHDGRYLYVACEGSAEGINPNTMKKYRDPTEVASTRNGVVLCPGCRRGIDSCDNESKPGRTRNGLLAVIDVEKATKGMGQESIVTIISAGCSPVRAIETTDGQHVWVAARGRNTQLPLPADPDARGFQVLSFKRSVLVSGSPNHAFVGYGDTHGTAPVGIALFNNDSLLAVANSNRFHANEECRHPPPGVPPCTANVAIMDVSNPAEPTVLQTVRAFSNDSFPRNVTVSPDDFTLYVPNATAMKLEVITTSVK